MKSDSKPKERGKGYAQVPHEIVDASIPDVLKLLLWYCYDKSQSWTFSVSEVARSLAKTPQCVRKYFRAFTDAGVFTRAGEKQVKHGIVLLYTFHRDKVPAFIQSQLKVNPETDPETDRETNPETDPETGRSGTKNNIPRLSTEKDDTKNENTQNEGTKGVEGLPSLKSSSNILPIGVDLAEEFERFFHQNADTKPITSSAASRLSGQPQPAEGGVPVGITSTAVAHCPQSTIIQSACGNSNGDGKNNPDDGIVPVKAPVIRASASGNTNTGAPDDNAGHPGTSAHSAAGTRAKVGEVRGPMPSDAEWCARMLIRGWKQSPYWAKNASILEAEFRKRLAQEDWRRYSSSFLAMSAVKSLKEQVERELG